MPVSGDPAPDFNAPTADGKHLSLSSLRGHPLVLYFYPEADTSGCTLESKGFRDIYAELQAKHVQVVGVSVDGVDAQCKFADKYHLPFPLLADSTKQVATAYGVLRPSGRANRVTFFIDAQGKITDVLASSDAAGHVTRARKLYL